ncbi:MAG: hypothetical protein VYE77_10400 [Planctomycetota bacterium]|nr:hypothetical protein [Planctomycetota bacterium]
MAKRPSAGSRSASSRRSRTRPRSGSTARARTDGKIDIYCPQCAAHYRIPETSVDSKVQCTQCKRTFFAKTTAGKRTKAPDNTKVYIGFGVGVLVFIIGLVALSGGNDTPRREPEPQVTKTGPSPLELEQRQREEQIKRWVNYVATSDLIGIGRMSDMPALAAVLGVPDDLEGPAFDNEFLKRATNDDCMRLLFEMDCTAAEAQIAEVGADSGSGTLYLAAKPGDTVYDKRAGAQLAIQWRMVNGTLQVTSCAIKVPPVIRGPRSGGNKIRPSADVAKPEIKEINLGGEKVKVRESPPVPLGHLEGTTPAQQAKIDELVTQLIDSADPESPGYLFGRTTNALDKIVIVQEDGKERKPAIPRLLNALNDLYPDVMANNDKLKQINKALLQLTGMEFAYDFRGNQPSKKPARVSTIRQWFAWWWRYANDTHTEAIDQVEDLDKPDKSAGDGK